MCSLSRKITYHLPTLLSCGCRITPAKFVTRRVKLWRSQLCSVDPSTCEPFELYIWRRPSKPWRDNGPGLKRRRVFRSAKIALTVLRVNYDKRASTQERGLNLSARCPCQTVRPVLLLLVVSPTSMRRNLFGLEQLSLSCNGCAVREQPRCCDTLCTMRWK